MKLQVRRLAGSAALLALAGALLVGCGGSDSTSPTTTEAETTAGGGGGAEAVEIKMGEFYFDPSEASAPAGNTTIEAPNDGAVEHELVLFKTDKDPADLPTEANGEVNEEKLDKEAEEAGEIADVEPGATKSESFKLTPGKYVMFCNLPGHYAAGMYGTVTVK
jgi:uncharacterized cupredoxin-like copper-binding protein